jgi:hypothetical protein
MELILYFLLSIPQLVVGVVEITAKLGADFQVGQAVVALAAAHQVMLVVPAQLDKVMLVVQGLMAPVIMEAAAVAVPERLGQPAQDQWAAEMVA